MNAPEWDLSIAYSGLDDPKIPADIAFVRERLSDLLRWCGAAQQGDVLRQALTQSELARITAYNLAEYASCLLAVNSGDEDARKLSGTMDKLLAEARENPLAVTVAMSSLGGDDHFALIKLQNATETEFTIVPFRGSAPARTALLGGHVAMGILNISEVAEFQDQLNVLGVATTQRSPFAPDLPTFQEQGLDLVNGSMRGFIAPAGLPDDVQEKLISAFEQLSTDQEFLDAMAATSNPVEIVTGDDFRQLTSDLYDLAQNVWETTPWN